MTELVEYIIVMVQDQDSLATLVPALAELVETSTIRILDLVVVARDCGGAVAVREFDAVKSIAALADVEGEVGGLLSEHDIALTSLALPPGSVAVVMVIEDRWAQSLSAAARRSGGRLIGGERIPPSRVEAALAERSERIGTGR